VTLLIMYLLNPLEPWFAQDDQFHFLASSEFYDRFGHQPFQDNCFRLQP